MGKPKIVPSFSTPDKNAKWKIKLKKELSKRLGILRWITTYSKMDAISDLIAGITLGLTIVPQSIAYASLARLPAETGLYSAFAGGFLYVIFGTIKQVSIGPTSLMALVTLQYISSVPNQYMLQYLHLFTFLCGMVELLMGILRLGFLTEVISTPVISGFTTASAIIIIVSQIKPILGVSFKSESFNEDIIKLIKNIRNCRKGDALLGLSCIIFLLSLRQMRNYQSKNKLLKKLCWFTSIARNAITVLICGVIAYGIKYYGFRDDIFKLTSEVHSGLPSLKPPSFGINDGNTTITFIEMFQQLKTGVIVIPIVAVLINVSIAKTFATGGTVDATQEMLSLAFCNIFASFLSSMPICGAFTRSAVSNASGVRTPFANFYAAMITILALKFITPSFHYIPKATLAGVLISAVIFLIDVDIFKRLWITCKRDFSILSTTIFLCLYFGVEVGLLIGVVINLFFLLYVWARPRINTEKRKNEYGEIVVVTPELGLFFLGSEHLYTYLSKLADNNTNNVTVAVNCCYFKGIDYSAMKVGLLSSVVGGFVYSLLGTVKELSIGPTAMMSLLTDQYTHNMVSDSIAVFCFGCAVVALLLSILRLGLVVEFISLPVSSAFGSAVALTILAAELKNLTGLTYKSNKFVESLQKFYSHAKDVKLSDISLGIACMVVLTALDKVKYLPIPKYWKRRDEIKKVIWLIMLSRNAITLLMACMLTKYFEKTYGSVPYKLSDSVTPGFPEFRIPWSDTQINNNATITFREKVQLLYPGMIVTPIVSLLVHVSIAKFFDSANTIKIGHELLSLSICNFLCSFFNSSPIAGAFSRSAVSTICDVRTPISNIYAAILAGLALNLLTPYFGLIPKAALSAVIVTAICSVVDYKIIFPLWNFSRKEIFVLISTLSFGLYYGIEVGLITGVITNLIILVYLWARPSVEISKCENDYGDYVLVTPDLGLFYPAVSYLETLMYKTLKNDPYKNLPIAVNCQYFKGFDYTAVKGLIRIIKVYRKQKRTIVFFGVNPSLLSMCAVIDDAVTLHFCINEQNFNKLLFRDDNELQTSNKGKKMMQENSNEINVNCAKINAGDRFKEAVPPINMEQNQNCINFL